MRPLITPRTKVGELLAAYPDLEEFLIGLAPAFAKLRNPILRRTVAKVATLQAAAGMAGMEVSALVAALRERVGIDPAEADTASADDRMPADSSQRFEFKPTIELDVDTLLEGGLHPLAEVKQALAGLASGETIGLSCSFRPEPLIEQLRADGYRIQTQTSPEGRWETLIGKTDARKE